MSDRIQTIEEQAQSDFGITGSKQPGPGRQTHSSHSDPNDQVEVFDLLPNNQRSLILSKIDIQATAQLFTLQEDQDTLEAAEAIPMDRLADILDEMAPDEAADLLLDLPSTTKWQKPSTRWRRPRRSFPC